MSCLGIFFVIPLRCNNCLCQDFVLPEFYLVFPEVSLTEGNLAGPFKNRVEGLALLTEHYRIGKKKMVKITDSHGLTMMMVENIP